LLIIIHRPNTTRTDTCANTTTDTFIIIGNVFKNTFRIKSASNSLLWTGFFAHMTITASTAANTS